MSYVGLRKTFKAEVQKDEETGDLYIEFSDELMEELGWEIGDEVEWLELPNGAWQLTKKDEDEKEK